MWELWCDSCQADLDLWLKPETRPENSFGYYSYIWCYVDDIVCIHHVLNYVLNKLNHYKPLKPSSVSSPNTYLGTTLKQMLLHNGIWVWSMNPTKYLWETIQICEKYVGWHLSKDYRLLKRAENSFFIGYPPELDVSLVLESDEAFYCNSLIGVMRWMVQIGCLY